MSKKKLFVFFLSGLIVLIFCVVSPIVSAYDCDYPSEEQHIKNRCKTFCKNKGDVAECATYMWYGDCEGQCVCKDGSLKEIQSVGVGGGGGGGNNGGCRPPYCQQN
ncbi:MAG: hypothetical protein EHM45_04555 [Desulfobacteraceae bacterium]|nr:MAG: hypothetical protein EHM45_04555 [Desulfobacteraceae bacterium]